MQCLEAIRDTLDDLAYYLLQRAPSSSSCAAAVAFSSSSLSHHNVAGGSESPLPLASGAGMGGPHTPSGSVDDGGDISDDVSDSSSHAIEAASRELALRCAHNIARSSRAVGTDISRADNSSINIAPTRAIQFEPLFVFTTPYTQSGIGSSDISFVLFVHSMR